MTLSKIAYLHAIEMLVYIRLGKLKSRCGAKEFRCGARKFWRGNADKVIRLIQVQEMR